MSHRKQVSLAHYNVDPQRFVQGSADDLHAVKPVDVIGYTPLACPVSIIPGSKAHVVGFDSTVSREFAAYWIEQSRIAAASSIAA